MSAPFPGPFLPQNQSSGNAGHAWLNLLSFPKKLDVQILSSDLRKARKGPEPPKQRRQSLWGLTLPLKTTD